MGKHGGRRNHASSWVYVHSGNHWLMDWKLVRVRHPRAKAALSELIDTQSVDYDLAYETDFVQVHSALTSADKAEVEDASTVARRARRRARRARRGPCNKKVCRWACARKRKIPLSKYEVGRIRSRERARKRAPERRAKKRAQRYRRKEQNAKRAAQ